MDLENFLKEHEGEWWTPSEIGIELGVDLRTVKNVIRDFYSMTLDITYKGWRMNVAERSRLYCVRMIRDIESSRNLTKAEVSKVKGSRIGIHTSSKIKQTLLKPR